MRKFLFVSKLVGTIVLFLALIMTVGIAEEEALAELLIAVPDGVTEIDLRMVLGDDVLAVEDAWMLNTDASVILRQLPEIGGYELVLLDLRDLLVLSRTPIPHVRYYWHPQGWDDGVFYMLFPPKGSDMSDPAFSYIKAVVEQDGTVDAGSSAPGRTTVMPGGKVTIREVDDGSLYAVNLDNGEEELLIQGVAGYGGEYSYEAYLGYVPCRDDAGYNAGEDGEPLSTPPFPLDEDSFHDYWPFFYREFYVYKPLDEYRFVYTAKGWEWGAGFGIYDLQTHTDHRITGSGYFYGARGNTLYGSFLTANADTYESSPLPKTVRQQLGEINAMEDGRVDYDISPDGRLLALTGMQSRYGDADDHTVTITDIQTGKVIQAYDIRNPFASEYRVTFYDNTRFMLFFQPEEFGSAYIYLFDAEE